MSRKIARIVLIVAAVAIPAAVAEAGKAQRAYVEASPKDCTRLNGRWGYYGNPWCSPAEQLRWDRWEARRFSR